MTKQIDATWLLMMDYSHGVSKGGIPYVEVDAEAAEEGDELAVRVPHPELVDVTGLTPRATIMARSHAIQTHYSMQVIGHVTGLGQIYKRTSGEVLTYKQRAYYSLI